MKMDITLDLVDFHFAVTLRNERRDIRVAWKTLQDNYYRVEIWDENRQRKLGQFHTATPANKNKAIQAMRLALEVDKAERKLTAWII